MSESKIEARTWLQTFSGTPLSRSHWRWHQILNHCDPPAEGEEGSPGQYSLFDITCFLQPTPFPPGRWAHSGYSSTWLCATSWSGFGMWSVL